MSKKKKYRGKPAKVDDPVFDRMEKYVKENGITIKFYTTMAVERQLDRDMIKKLK